MWKLAVTHALALGVGACLLHGGGSPEWADEFEEEFGAQNAQELILEVRNDNFYDATLYAVTGGHRERLGIVSSHSSETFTFRWALPDLQIEIDLLSAGSVYTTSLPVEPGETLQLIIEPDAHRRARE